MDKRLELTEAQWRLVHRFNDLCREMKRNGIGFVNQPGSIHLINLNHVDDYVFPEEMNPEDDIDEELVDFEDMTPCDMDIFYASADVDDNMGIRFK